MPYNPYYAYHMAKKHLYNSQNWTDNQVKAFNLMYGFNFMGFTPWKGMIDYIYDSRAGDKYRERWGISGGGYDPRKAPDANLGASLSSNLNYVSKNVERLYEDPKRDRHKANMKEVKRILRDYYSIW